MKKSLTLKILEILGRGIMTSTDIVTAILESGYGASYSKMNRNYRRLESQRIDRINEAEEKQRFYNLIAKLKREGFIVGKRNLKITKLGRDKLWKGKNAEVREAISFLKYKPERDGKTKIVIFDIPEHHRHKRAWLRFCLVRLGFKILQKSVWIGEVKIPEEFLEDLKLMKIDRCVHIFFGEKLGTIDAD